jgi:hypothetical protein
LSNATLSYKGSFGFLSLRCFEIHDSSSLNKSVKPISILDGWIKFFFPLIIKLPVGRYSPEGADFDT